MKRTLLKSNRDEPYTSLEWPRVDDNEITGIVREQCDVESVTRRNILKRSARKPL